MKDQIRIKKFCFVLVILFMIMTGKVLAEESISNFEKGIFNLEHIGLKISAVENDMRFFIEWKPTEKPKWQEPAEQAVKDLDGIKNELNYLDLPQELDSLQAEFGEVIEELKKVYSEIQSKSDEIIKEELDSFWRKVEVYNQNFKVFINQHLKMPELSEGFEVLDEEIAYIDDDDDKKDFQQAIDFMDNKEYKQAHGILLILLEKYRKSPLEASMISRIVDCREMKNTKLNEEIAGGDSIEILSNFLNSGQYSPRLYKIFEQWRTLEQFSSHGASNWSVIPNEKYIKKRWMVVRNIEKYLENNPDNSWAKWQIALLMDLPIIQRGDPFGNTNIRHWAALFGYLGKDNEKDEQGAK